MMLAFTTAAPEYDFEHMVKNKSGYKANTFCSKIRGY